jgi:uncharacterized membrane protein YvbJ
MIPCPHCGEEIEKNAIFCPHCGSDEETGWSSHTYLDGIDLPDEVSYEEISRNEFGSIPRRTGSKRLMIILIVIATVAILIAWILVNRI